MIARFLKSAWTWWRARSAEPSWEAVHYAHHINEATPTHRRKWKW